MRTIEGNGITVTAHQQAQTHRPIGPCHPTTRATRRRRNGSPITGPQALTAGGPAFQDPIR